MKQKIQIYLIDMLPSSLKSSGYTTSVASSQIRKEVLWNVQEPGDPYDIRKSMIAKLPGGKTFMGDHLEFICLFQAAEIQRLSDFLQNYKYKFKDIERMTLDRHSYEIQIKQLTLKLADEDNLRNQILKYKQFIKKQTGQIQALHEKLRQTQNMDDNFKTFYEQSNQKINILTLENNQLRKSNSNYQSMLEAYERAKIKQIQQFRIKITQTSQEQSDKNLLIFKNHIEGQLKKLEFQIRKLKDQNSAKDKEIARLNSEIQQYQLQHQKIKSKSESQVNLQNRIKDNQAKIALFSQQIERLNMFIRQSNSKSEDYQRNNIEYIRKIHFYQNQVKEDQHQLIELKNQISRLNEMIRQLENQSRKSNEIQQYIIQYESRIKTLSTEIQSLNSKILYEANNSKLARQEAERLSFENSKIKLLTKENSQLRERSNEINEIKRKLAQFENSLTLKNQQLQRLQGQIRSKDNQLSQLRGLALQNETLRGRLNQTQNSLSKQYETEILRIRTEYEQKITIISQNKVGDLESKVGNYQKELAKIRELLSLKTDQYERQRLGYLDLQQRYKRFESQSSLKLKNYEISIDNLKRENEDASSKTRLVSQYQRKIAELQNRASLLEAQCQRLNSLVKSKQQQINGLKNRVRQLQGLTKKYELDSRLTIEQNITIYKTENDDLKRKISELTSEYSKKNNQNFAEFSKLNTSMRTLLDQKVQLENQNKQYFQQLQYIRLNFQKISKENEQFRRKNNDIQNKLASSANENTLNIKNWQIENENLKRQNQQMKNSLSNYESEFAIRASRHEQNLAVLTKQNEQLRKRLRQIQSTLPQLSLQFEKLNQKHKIKCDQLSNLEITYKNSTIQIENLRRYIKQYQTTITTKYQVQVTRKYSAYESTIQNISRQNDEFRRKYGDLEGRYSQINFQYEKTLQNLKISTQENENLKRQLNQRQVSSTNFESDTNRKFANYQTNINNLTRNYQDAQRKLTEQQFALKQRLDQYNRLDINYKSLIQENDTIRKRYKDLELSTTQKLEGQVAKRYQNYEQTIAKLNQQNDELKRKLNEVTIQHNKRVGEINNITPALSENQNLKKKLEKYDISIAQYETEVNRRFATYQQTIQTISKENQQYKRKLAQLQNRFALVSQELERTNNNLRVKSQQLNKSQLKIRNIMIDLQNSRKQNVEMESHFNNIFENDVTKKYSNYEQTIADLKRKLNELSVHNQNLTLQIERTGSTLKVKGEQSSQIIVNFKNLSNQYEDFKRRVKENEGIYNQNLANLRKENDQLRRKIQDFELNFRQFGQENENKMKVVVQQIQRLNLTIKTKNQQIERNRKQIKQFQNLINQKTEVELKNKVYFENTVSSNVRQIQQLRRRLQEFGDVHKRSVDYQSNLKITSLELQKLRNLLKLKSEEYLNLEIAYKNLAQQNQKLQFALKNKSEQLNKTDQKLRQFTIQMQNFRRQITEQQRVTTSKYEVQITRRTSTFEQNITVLNRQRQQLLKKKSDYQNKIGLLTTEIERLNMLVKSRTDDLQRNMMETQNLRQQAQKKILSSESQFTTLQSNYKKVVNQYEISKKHLVQYETNIKKIHMQFQRLQQIIDQLKKERQMIFDKNHFLGEQIERLTAENRDLQTQTKDVRLRLSDESSLQKRINQHLGLMVILFTQIESLRKRVTDKQKQVEYVRRSSLSPHILKH